MPYVELGDFHRDMTYIPDRITRDGRDGWPSFPRDLYLHDYDYAVPHSPHLLDELGS